MIASDYLGGEDYQDRHNEVYYLQSACFRPCLQESFPQSAMLSNQVTTEKLCSTGGEQIYIAGKLTHLQLVHPSDYQQMGDKVGS